MWAKRFGPTIIGPAVTNEAANKSIDNGKKLIPIFRSKREFFRCNVSCSRTQFPITIAY